MSVTARMNRLFGVDGKCFDVAIDHGFFGVRRFLNGIENMKQVIETVVDANPDAIQLTIGQAPVLQSIPGKAKPSLVLRTDIANVYERRDGTGKEPTGPFRHSGRETEGDEGGAIVEGQDDISKVRIEYSVSFKHITDGLSNTMFVGEKHIPVDGPNGSWFGHEKAGDNSVYNADAWKTVGRKGGHQNPIAEPNNGSQGGSDLSRWKRSFGSWHSGICQFVFGDGHVESVSNDIDRYMLGHFCNKADGYVVDLNGQGVPFPETQY